MISKGVLPMDLFCILLKANSAWAKATSHYFGCSLQMHLIKFPNVRLVTSVYPSVCGLLVVLHLNSVANVFHNVFQKWLKNFTSRSEVINLRTL